MAFESWNQSNLMRHSANVFKWCGFLPYNTAAGPRVCRQVLEQQPMKTVWQGDRQGMTAEKDKF